MDAAYIFGVMAFAAFLQTVTSFGYALAATPLLLFIMSPKDAVAFVLITGILQKSILIYRTWHEGSFRSIRILILAGIPGAIAGSYLVKILGDSALKLLIGIILLAAMSTMRANVTFTFRNRTLAQTIVGVISGFLGSSTSFSGPPIMMYMLNEKEEKEVIRANLARYFILGNALSLTTSYLFGNFSPANLFTNILVSIPGILCGYWIGDKLFCRLDAAAFRKMALWVIGASAMISIGSGLWPLLKT
jgi:uncharacterized membrane protein YfcA